MNVFQLEYTEFEFYPHYKTIGIYHSKDAAYKAMFELCKGLPEIVKEDFHYSYYTTKGVEDYRIVKRTVL